jgi:hypothetical protein
VSEAASVVIPSTAFFSKEWPRKELDALVARDDGNAKVILPIWHRLSAEDVRRKSPLLADKVAIAIPTTSRWSLTVYIALLPRAHLHADFPRHGILPPRWKTLSSASPRIQNAALEELTRLVNGQDAAWSSEALTILKHVSERSSHPLSKQATAILVNYEQQQRVARQAEQTIREHGPLGRFGNGICPKCGHSMRPSYRGRGDMTVERCEACDQVDAWY